MKIYVRYDSGNPNHPLIPYEVEKLGLSCKKVQMGEIVIGENISINQLNLLKNALIRAGFQVLESHRDILAERVKIVIFEMVHRSGDPVREKISNYISERLNHDYTYLANLFSRQTGTTIEHFVIREKIRKVKDLLAANELSLKEIAFKLHYSSVAHLSNQFKKETGMTPTLFRQLQEKNAIQLNMWD
jgi:AraC-like DNA-binding protein